MFKHSHPYPAFIPDNATKLIVGTLPPPRFTTGHLKQGDVNFCYGSRDGQLWKILSDIFNLDLTYENTLAAINQRKKFLRAHKIGICDMVAVAYREKIDASDLGIKQPELRDLIAILKQHKRIKQLLFMGGNAKNGPEYFFRKVLKNYDLKLEQVEAKTPKEHRLLLDGREIKTVSLTAPSGAANRAVGSMGVYKAMKKKSLVANTLEFRVWQYTPYFLS